MRKFTGAAGLAIGFVVLAALEALAHGDVTPHPVDTTGLPSLGKEWVAANPYRGNDKAVAIGAIGYLHNCAGCHGLNAEAGGMAPDLLLVAKDCVDIASQRSENRLFHGHGRIFQGRGAGRQEEQRGPRNDARLQQRFHTGSRVGDQGLP